MKKKQLTQAEAKRRLKRNFFMEALKREDRAIRSVSQRKSELATDSGRSLPSKGAAQP